MGLFNNSEHILIDAVQSFRYVGGGSKDRQLQAVTTVSAETIRDQDALKKAAVKKLTALCGTSHPISGQVTATDPETGRTVYARFYYKPKKEVFAVPDNYQKAKAQTGTRGASAMKKAEAAGKTAVGIAKAIDNGFMTFMGGAPKKDHEEQHKKRSTGGTKKKSTKSTGTRKAAPQKRKTTAKKNTSRRR